jgi:hypothetical protein
MVATGLMALNGCATQHHSPPVPSNTPVLLLRQATGVAIVGFDGEPVANLIEQLKGPNAERRVPVPAGECR